MRQDEVQEFQRVLSGALSLWRQDVSEFALSVWWAACKDFSLEQVRKALTAHAMDPERGRFPPMPADMVKVLHGTQTDRSLLAWGRVHQAMQLVGAYASPDFADPAIVSAVTDMGGWPALCRTQLDELPFLQKRFCDLYRAYSARPEAQHSRGDAPLSRGRRRVSAARRRTA
jgi:hypothetical protein